MRVGVAWMAGRQLGRVGCAALMLSGLLGLLGSVPRCPTCSAEGRAPREVQARAVTDAGPTGEEHTILRLDSGLAMSYWPSWKAGDAMALRLRVSDLQYPLVLCRVQVCLTTFEDSGSSVDLQAHIYSGGAAGPDQLLASSDVQHVSLGVSVPEPSVTLQLPSGGLSLPSPRLVFVVVECLDGIAGATPAVWLDISTDIPSNVCYYRSDNGAWTEHYEFWQTPAMVGYPMVRVVALTSGGPGDMTELEATADTMLLSGLPKPNVGSQSYLQVGNEPPWTPWGRLRTLVQFPMPQRPITGAVPISATVRLYHYQTVTEMGQTDPLTITAHAVTTGWDEDSATWSTHADAFDAVPIAEATVPPYDELVGLRDYLVSWDISELFLRWWQGTADNLGLMLIGREDLSDSRKRFGSRERQQSPERPLLIIRWDLPTPTPGVQRLYLPIINKL